MTLGWSVTLVVVVCWCGSSSLLQVMQVSPGYSPWYMSRLGRCDWDWVHVFGGRWPQCLRSQSLKTDFNQLAFKQCIVLFLWKWFMRLVSITSNHELFQHKNWLHGHVLLSWWIYVSKEWSKEKEKRKMSKNISVFTQQKEALSELNLRLFRNKTQY